MKPKHAYPHIPQTNYKDFRALLLILVGCIGVIYSLALIYIEVTTPPPPKPVLVEARFVDYEIQANKLYARTAILADQKVQEYALFESSELGKEYKPGDILFLKKITTQIGKPPRSDVSYQTLRIGHSDKKRKLFMAAIPLIGSIALFYCARRRLAQNKKQFASLGPRESSPFGNL